MRARALVVLALLVPCAARADAATEARLREALRTATAQARALEDERAAGQAREAALKQELDALRAQAAAAGGAKTAQREVAELRRRLAAQTDASERASSELARCQAASREGLEAARAKEDERTRALAEAAGLRERLTAAETKNERLYRVGKEIIDWLERLGVGAALAAREPFLGLKRVQLENAAQDYEDRLLEQRLVPATAARP